MLSRCPTRASLKIIDFCSEKVSVNQAAKFEMVRMERESLFSWKHPLNCVTENGIAISHINIRSLPRHYIDLVSHKILQSLTVLCTHAPREASGEDYPISGFKFCLKHTQHRLAILTKKLSSG
ncbi:hypothetical protein KUTeg_012312 [Tegillarca granosa]|uniref:Uncharacterized protein n=1 Tax=Tegillarca granosa TaxID=220873 RepID=A0ABQ9EZ56_TEGGR|nr:hypothetical protein KUTeg_012312 [Tegillarca granosa]